MVNSLTKETKEEEDKEIVKIAVGRVIAEVTITAAVIVRMMVVMIILMLDQQTIH